MLLQRLIAWAKRIQLSIYTVLITLLVAFNSLVFRVRMSHENGVSARARIRILDDPRRPAHDFFVNGREFVGRVRHGAASFNDDAKKVVRSASVKFSDTRGRTPFALLMNTGDAPLFWDARTFASFMVVTMLGRGKYFVSHLRKYPQALVGGSVSVRRDPESFAGMSYHTQTCSGLIAADESRHLVRYRMIPWDGWSPETETGTPEPWDAALPWLQNPFQDETRTRNYLKDELIERVNDRKGRVRFRLQMQVRPWLDGPTQQWASSAWPWDEVETPWLELAEVELTEVLDYKEAMLTWFEITQAPKTLPIPNAVSIDDPHSLNHLRRASSWGRRARLFAYKIFGMLKKFPDSRHAPDWTSEPPMAEPPGP